jgi:hypothetical protein
MKSQHFFALGPSFLDPLKTKDDKPYGPFRYEEIIKECYLISKNTHTSYNDVLDMSTIERAYMLQIIAKEIKLSNDALAKAKAEREAQSQRKQ